MKTIFLALALATSWATDAQPTLDITSIHYDAGIEVEPTPDLTPPHIAGEAQYVMGEKIRLRFDGATPPDAKIAYAWGGLSGENIETERGGADGDQLTVWTTKPGVFTAELVVTYQISTLKPGPNFKNDKTDIVESTLILPLPTLKHLFVVGTPEPEPGPVPDGPTPAPVLGPLGALLPETPTVRAALVEFFADLAQAVRDGAFTSTGHFRSGYRAAITEAKKAGELPLVGLAPIDKPISDRIAAAIGLADVAFDASKQSQLAMTLDKVSEDFRDK